MLAALLFTTSAGADEFPTEADLESYRRGAQWSDSLQLALGDFYLGGAGAASNRNRTHL